MTGFPDIVEREVLVTQSCPMLYDPMDCSPPGSSVHGISQARILEWVDISFSRGPSKPRDPTCVPYLVGRLFTTEPPGKPQNTNSFVDFSEHMKHIYV